MNTDWAYLRSVKKPVAILLILSFTFQVCGKLAVAGWFSLNQRKLTELFCINKQKSESKCNGTCYLNKKLKEADGETQQGSTVPTGKVKSGPEEIWFCENKNELLPPVKVQSILIAEAPDNYSYLSDVTIFQPPRL